MKHELCITCESSSGGRQTAADAHLGSRAIQAVEGQSGVEVNVRNGGQVDTVHLSQLISIHVSVRAASAAAAAAAAAMVCNPPVAITGVIRGAPELPKVPSVVYGGIVIRVNSSSAVMQVLN